MTALEIEHPCKTEPETQYPNNSINKFEAKNDFFFLNVNII